MRSYLHHDLRDRVHENVNSTKDFRLLCRSEWKRKIFTYAGFTCDEKTRCASSKRAHQKRKDKPEKVFKITEGGGPPVLSKEKGRRAVFLPHLLPQKKEPDTACAVSGSFFWGSRFLSFSGRGGSPGDPACFLSGPACFRAGRAHLL